MAAMNDVTGKSISSAPTSKAYKDNWDAIFGKKDEPQESKYEDSEVRPVGTIEIPEPEIFDAVQVLTQYQIGNEFRGTRETLCIDSVMYDRGSIAVDAMTFAFYLWRFGSNLKVSHYGNASKVYTRDTDTLVGQHECITDEYRIFEQRENRKVL